MRWQGSHFPWGSIHLVFFFIPLLFPLPRCSGLCVQRREQKLRLENYTKKPLKKKKRWKKKKQLISVRDTETGSVCYIITCYEIKYCSFVCLFLSPVSSLHPSRGEKEEKKTLLKKHETKRIQRIQRNCRVSTRLTFSMACIPDSSYSWKNEDSISTHILKDQVIQGWLTHTHTLTHFLNRFTETLTKLCRILAY